ncbi:MAG: patatin family protein [Clostridiales bacterium]|nr:patatin family protein [Clostridiales bacterium]
MKVGIIDVGGGFRGIYAAGVLDYCQDNSIEFDLALAISAGSANLASFIARQRGRNYTFYTQYAFRKQYASLRNFILGKGFFDMEYIFGTLSGSNGENPLDYSALRDNPAEFIVIATDAATGEAVYFDKSAISQDNYAVFKASSSIPFVNKPYVIDGKPYYDGALGDPVPVEKAFELGCDLVILMLSKPADKPREQGSDAKLAKRIRKKYPKSAEQLCLRAQHYNEGVAIAREYAKQGKLIIVSPDDTCGVDTLHKDREALKKLYEKGYADGSKIKEFLQQKGRLSTT